MQELKIALVHEYLVQNGGAEKVLEAIHDIFPTSVVFTSAFEKDAFPKEMEAWDIRVSSIQGLPFYKSLSKQYTCLYPLFFESFDLREFDIVISSWSAWSKAVITQPKQLHVSYCHTPPRFLYKYKGESSKRDAWYYKPFVAFTDSFLRIWDYTSAQRPDFLIANSETVRQRIKKFYRRDATIIYPPIKTQRELILPEKLEKFDTNYYLIVSRLAAYKNIDIVIEAFNNLNLPLRIVGSGKEEARLKKVARGNIAFMGGVDDREKSILYQNCKGIINAVADEDFGIVPVEALSFGKPVLAHKSGGHLETIIDGKTGMFFDELSVPSIVNALQKFDAAVNANNFDPLYLKNSVQRFDESIFKEKFKAFVMEKWEERKGA